MIPGILPSILDFQHIQLKEFRDTPAASCYRLAPYRTTFKSSCRLFCHGCFMWVPTGKNKKWIKERNTCLSKIYDTISANRVPMPALPNYPKFSTTSRIASALQTILLRMISPSNKHTTTHSKTALPKSLLKFSITASSSVVRILLL